MLLSTYIGQVQSLLQSPPAPVTLYATSVVTTGINFARQQLASEAFCVKQIKTFNTVSGTSTYPLASVTFAASTGVSGVINANQLWVSDVGFNKWVTPRSWEWYSLFSNMNNPAMQQGTPTVWSQYSSGTSGIIYLDPIPDGVYTITIDTTCIPIALNSDSDAEAIPYPYTDCVQYLAAYSILLSAQSAARQDDANRMYQRYKEFLDRAQRGSLGGVLPEQYDHNPDSRAANRLRTQRNTLGGIPRSGEQSQ